MALQEQFISFAGTTIQLAGALMLSYSRGSLIAPALRPTPGVGQ